MGVFKFDFFKNRVLSLIHHISNMIITSWLFLLTFSNEEIVDKSTSSSPTINL